MARPCTDVPTRTVFDFGAGVDGFGVAAEVGVRLTVAATECADPPDAGTAAAADGTASENSIPAPANATMATAVPGEVTLPTVVFLPSGCRRGLLEETRFERDAPRGCRPGYLAGPAPRPWFTLGCVSTSPRNPPARL